MRRGHDSSARLVSVPASGIGSRRGTAHAAGRNFGAYTKSLDIFDLMLARMMGTADDGKHDRLMEFSRAVTGATFFAPSLETIASLKP
ncbi:MAG: Dyp-type peroxidase [Nitrospira sp.]|nr:Dyp-type peroxidase [Nitrospira sp.]